MSIAPKTIWLQWYGDADPDEAGEPDHEDVTWCEDKINDSDVEYVSADALATAEERIKELEAERKRLEKSQMDLGEAWAREIRKNNLERSLSDKMEEALTALVPCTAAGADCIGPYNTAKHVLAEVAALRAKETI